MSLSQLLLPVSPASRKDHILFSCLDFRLLYLFTASDLKTIAFPSSVFGVIGFACKQVVVPTTSTPISIYTGLLRWPLVFFWVWVNLLPFNINNQSVPGAMAEDKINKGWRPLPSGLVNVPQARMIMMYWYVIAIFSSWILGSLPQCLALIGLGFFYNYGGADVSWVVRNAINAFGYLSFITGAITVAAKSPRWTPLGYFWLAIIALIIFTTVQLQDLEDQDGDRARQRITMPLHIGDGVCRIWSAFAVALWSFLVVWLWQLEFWLHIITLGFVISFRCLRWRSVQSDRLTFKIWNLWVICIYAAPLLSQVVSLP